MKMNILSSSFSLEDGNGVVRGNYLSVFLELSAGLPETSKYEEIFLTPTVGFPRPVYQF